jgi:hypothetical protein
MELTQAVKNFLTQGNFTKREIEYITFDMTESNKGNWTFNSVEDIKNYYSNTENQYCFVVYAVDQTFASELMEKILEFFGNEKKYNKCKLFAETYPEGLEMVEVNENEKYIIKDCFSAYYLGFINQGENGKVHTFGESKLRSKAKIFDSKIEAEKFINEFDPDNDMGLMVERI